MASGSATPAWAAGERRADADAAEPMIDVTYFTDPLCSWSWALEPHWRRLRRDVGRRLAWRYRMGGLLADWGGYSDPINAIDRPLQMGPQWYQVRQVTGVPIDERLWHEDPPASSYPACLAVKAAERQGAAAGEAYLARLRSAAMTERRNIARREVLLGLAEEVGAAPLTAGGIDVARFNADLERPETLEAFREDLKEAGYRGIGRFPTLVLRRQGGRGLIIVGYRPYAVLRAAVLDLAPELVAEVSPE